MKHLNYFLGDNAKMTYLMPKNKYFQLQQQTDSTGAPHLGLEVKTALGNLFMRVLDLISNIRLYERDNMELYIFTKFFIFDY